MNKKILQLSFFISLLCCGINSDSQVTWERLFSRKSTDVFRCVIEVPSGGYALAGYTADSTSNDSDAYVVRLNVNGDTLWTKRFNGPGSGKDHLYKIVNTSDGGFICCGYSISYPSLTDDLYYMKLDGNGNQQWVKAYGGSQRDRAEDVVQTADGGFAIAGTYGSPPSQYYDAILLRVNSSGDTMWSKLYGTPSYENFNSIKLLPDGGFILAGKCTNGANGLDYYLVRTNSNGDTIWTKKFGTTGTDNIECVIRNADGTFILCGSSNGVGTNSDDGVIMKTDSGGNVLWTKSYGLTTPDDFHFVSPVTGGGYILSGTTSSFGYPNPDLWLFKVNSSGDSLWSKTFGGNRHDHGYCARQASDGGYILTGYTGSFGFDKAEDGYVIKTDGNGLVANPLQYTSVYSLISPLNNTCGNSATTIKVVVYNFGRDTVANIPVTIQITGATVQTLNQTRPGPVYPGDGDTLTFTTTLNTTAGGVYNFTCFTNNNNDVYPLNNGMTTSINIIHYSNPPGITNGSFCGPGNVVLGASSPDNIYWFSASTGGSQLGTGTSFSTPFISTNTTYYAQAGLTCPSSRVAVLATINSIPVMPVTTPGQNCGSGSVVLGASAADPIIWYDVQTGGSQIGNGITYNTPSISTTTTYYAEANNGTCASSRAAVIATILTPPSQPITTPGAHCGEGTVDLSATSANTIEWYDVPTGGSPLNSGSNFTTPFITNTTTFYAVANDGTCSSTRASALATIRTITPDPGITPASHCGPGSVTLGASSSDVLVWYTTSSGGTQVGTGSTYSTPFLTSTTTYYVQATDGICPGNYIAVDATIFTLPIVDLGPDQNVVNNTTLDAGTGFSLYSWSNSETTSSIFVNTSGTYCVTVTDGNNCTANDCVFVDVSNGVNDPELAAEIKLFPNPSSGLFSLQLGSLPKDVQFSIYSSTGKLLQSGQLQSGTTGAARQLDFSYMPKGIYLIRIESSGKLASIPFVIQ